MNFVPGRQAADRRKRARPLVLNGCFGWLHVERDDVGSDTAILLCPALSWDALHSHHTMRRLADAFASAGYPTLRFSYPGTGDSLELAETDAAPAEHWSCWQDSLHHAADWLRRATGARRLILVGLRIGATLATLVSQSRDDVAGLVLLAPVLRGKSYIRQLCMEAQLETGVSIRPDEGLDFHELCLSPESVRLISRVDLQTSEFGRPVQVAIFEQAASRLVDNCVAAWRGGGATVSCLGFAGLAPMLQQTIHGDTRMADLSGIIRWVRGALPALPVPLPPAALTQNKLLQPPPYRETPLCFGEGEKLFGILCQPRSPTSEVVVIIGNTGRDPHYGVARFGVEFARHLATQGIPSFRIDFAGLGDSIGPAGQEDELSALFETDRCPDITAAIDTLEGFGYRRFAMHGLCSGAYHGFHGAVADRRIEALLLVNFPKFVWEPGDTVEHAVREMAPPRHYVGKLWRRDFWRRLARNQVPVGSILRAQAARLDGRVRHYLLLGLERLGVIGPRSPARRAMATLAARGVKVLFLYSPVDPGIDAMEQAFGRGGVGLAEFGAAIRIVPGVDHLLSGRQMRRTVAALMVDFLTTTTNLAAPPALRAPPSLRRPAPVPALT
jgi:dienelactone hydrolase